MNGGLLKILQILGVIGLLAIGVALLWQFRDQPLTAGTVLALMAVALLECGLIAIGGFGGRGGGGNVSDVAMDGVLESVVGVVRKFLVVHRDYQAGLDGLNSGLSQLPSRAEVQDIIVKLMNRNMEMQSRVNELSRELEASHQQIVSLRSNITEVGKIAMIDSLTELGNRRFFDQALRNEIARARAGGADLCLAMADLDRFKAVNDRFGHVVGDHLLRLFADLVNLHVKGRGLAARYGGEEFALLFPGSGIETATAIVDKIRRELEAKRWVVGPKEDRLGTITASFGVAKLTSTETLESFVARADAKLFEAKSAGRNRVIAELSEDGDEALSKIPRIQPAR